MQACCADVRGAEGGGDPGHDPAGAGAGSPAGGTGEFDWCMPRTKRQIDKPDQRILHQDVIPPPGEKVFSVFEKHSLWNRKGKVALGHCASRIR